MHLKNCYVQGFGKLQNFTYEFTEGLNVICTENGWGKSTFAAFLRAMFYGLPQAGSRTKLEEAERRKYKPWNGGVMGGYLVFEANGKEYKAERTFGKKEAEDTFRLIDLSTNLDSGDFSENLGEELFGLDKEAYSRSTYLPQNKIMDGGMNDSIGKKLGKLAEGEEDGGNFDRAYGVLEELRKKYIPDRQKDEKGYVAELTRKVSDLQARIEACRRKEESAKPWEEKSREASERKKQLEKDLAVCRKQLEDAAAYEALAAKKQHYEELCGREESLRIKKQSLQELFRGEVPELSFLKECRQEIEEATVVAGELRTCRLEPGQRRELERLQERFGEEIPESTKVQEYIATERELQEKLLSVQGECVEAERQKQHSKAKKRRKLLLATGCLVLGLLLFCLSFFGRKKSEDATVPSTQVTEQTAEEKKDSSGWILQGAGGCFLTMGVVFLVLSVKYGKEEKQKEAECLLCSREKDRMRSLGLPGKELLQKYGFLTGNDTISGLYALAEEVRNYEELLSLKRRQEQCEAERTALLRNSRELLDCYGMDTEDMAGSLYVLENRTRDFLHISQEFEEAVKNREQFEKEQTPQSLQKLSAPEVGFAEAQKKERELLEEITRVTEEEKDCRNRAEAFLAEAEECTELEEQLEEVSGKLEAKKREHFYITETLKCLKTAKEQFSSRYMKQLRTAFDKYLSLLGQEDFEKNTAGNYNGIHADINLNIQVTAYGEEKELGYFSTGMKDLIGLCMRFALVDALFTEEQPFLVLDDPFVNLDEEKMKRATALLKETAKRYQILYLVCHESRV